MNEMLALLGMIQEDAAALATGDLRAEIKVHLDVFAKYVEDFKNLQRDAVSFEEMISATDSVLVGALATALFVRELTTRPADHQFPQVKISFN